MTPPKRPPPPSPLRKGTGARPAPPPGETGGAAGNASSAAKVDRTQEQAAAVRPLLLWGGVGIGLISTLGIAVLVVLLLKGPAESAANPAPAAAKEPAAAVQPPQAPADLVASAEVNPTAPLPVENSPPPIASSPSAPMPPPLPVDNNLALTNSPPAAPPATEPATTAPAQAQSAPAQPAPAPPSGDALADVRQRKNLLPIPDSKEVSRVNLTTIQVASPQQCDLTLLGGDELCPPGSSLKLVRQDPAMDERVWTVTIKSTGALSKERTLADFRLKGNQLTFQWQRLSGGGLIPSLMYCLLRIDAAGEQEICQLSKPLTAQPLPMKLADRWTIEAQIPGDSLGQAALSAEPLAIDFPNVSLPGAATLASGQTLSFTISGQTSGSLAVDLELEIKLEQKDGKWQLTVLPYAEPPNVAKADRAPVRSVISPAQIKRRKGELTKAATTAEGQLKALKLQLERLEKDETTLLAVTPTNVNQRNAVLQQLQQTQQQMAAVETKLGEAEMQQETLANAAAWFTDMYSLLEQLQNQAKLGVRLFRNVDMQRVVIAEPASS